jgi:multicomponent Na+:H+ antiporter subunit C
MNQTLLFGVTAASLFGSGFYGLIRADHLIRKLLALNLLGSGVFLMFIVMGNRAGDVDPLPQAMVLTGIVVAIATTAFGLALFVRLHRATGQTRLEDEAE